jgi:cytoplasmic tRNA 2-thiolation protein 2
MNLTTRPMNVTSAQSLTPLLCYACHTTLTSRGSRGIAAPRPPATQVPLPMWVHNHIDYDHGIALQTKLTEEGMKAEIEEFLLPDE